MQRPDPMIAAKPGASDVQAMGNRVAWLNCLYLHDKRDKREHPLHGKYTGLAQKYQQFIG